MRVRLQWLDGRIETVRAPVDAEVTSITRSGRDGRYHHFEVSKDIDDDGFVIAIEVPTAS